MSAASLTAAPGDGLDQNLVSLHDRLKANEWQEAKAICRSMFGCDDAPLDVLGQCLTASGFYALCAVMLIVREQKPDRRVQAALALPLVIDLDFATADARERALRAAQSILGTLPPSARTA